MSFVHWRPWSLRWLIPGSLLLACTRSPAAPEATAEPATLAPAPASEPRLAMPASVTSVEFDGLEAQPHRPMLVLVEEKPHRMVDGADVPALVMYEDGLVVFHGGRDAVQLPPADARKFVEKLATPEFLALPVLTRVRDRGGLPTVHISLRLGDRWRAAAVYGIPLGIVVLREGEPMPEGPPAFMQAYREVLAFESPAAAPWTPESLEVMLWDFAHAADEAPWPADVPAPPTDWKQPTRGVRHHIVAGSHEPALHKFLDELPETRAVAFNGERWSIDLRRIVPAEQYIRDVQQCIIKQTLIDPPVDAGPACHVHRAP